MRAVRHDMNEMKRTLCIQCASVLDSKYSACPFCGCTIDIDLYSRILDRMKFYLYYGYQYRKQYEEQYKEKGQIDVKYHLVELNEAFSWIGLALISGIIGGASWDFVKYVINKIASQLSNEKINNIVSNEKELELFSRYLLDHHHNLRGVREEIKEAILEEMIAHQAEYDPPKQIDFENAKQMKKLLMKYAKKAGEINRKNKISVKMINGLWSKIEITVNEDE